jgi:DNA-binding response OmpR family regulator
VRVLVIEDDQEMAETVAVGLRRARMAVDVAFDGRSGLERALISDYDVVVLDRDLPGLHGDEVCEKLVEAGCRSRVLMLTAAAEAEDLVNGLGLGADDYLPKPFDFGVLIARIGALIRRAQPAIPPALLPVPGGKPQHERQQWGPVLPVEIGDETIVGTGVAADRGTRKAGPAFVCSPPRRGSRHKPTPVLRVSQLARLVGSYRGPSWSAMS